MTEQAKTTPNEYFVMIYNKGASCSAGYENEQDAGAFLKKLQEENPTMFTDAYIAKVVEVIK